MLKIVNGNLFDHIKAPCVIAHGCNAQGKMRSGFAATLRRLYPNNYLTYALAHRQEGLKLGDFILHAAEEQDETIWIANLITQEFFGYDKNTVYVDYNAVEHGLRVVKDFALKSDLPIHMPFIGGGKANGDHNALMAIFTKVFDDYPATVWIDSPNIQRFDPRED